MGAYASTHIRSVCKPGFSGRQSSSSGRSHSSRSPLVSRVIRTRSYPRAAESVGSVRRLISLPHNVPHPRPAAGIALAQAKKTKGVIQGETPLRSFNTAPARTASRLLNGALGFSMKPTTTSGAPWPTSSTPTISAASSRPSKASRPMKLSAKHGQTRQADSISIRYQNAGTTHLERLAVEKQMTLSPRRWPADF